MTIDEGRKPEGAPERSPKAGEGAPSGVEGNWPKRFSVQRKMAIVARLLRGQPLELVARETEVSVAGLTEWRERALSRMTDKCSAHCCIGVKLTNVWGRRSVAALASVRRNLSLPSHHIKRRDEIAGSQNALLPSFRILA